MHQRPCTYGTNWRQSQDCSAFPCHHDPSTQKKEFLSNQDSKHMFTAMLFRSLEQSGCEVHQAKADADLLIIQTTAASVANPKETDLLVVLVYHAKSVHVHKSERCWYIPFL